MRNWMIAIAGAGLLSAACGKPPEGNADASVPMPDSGTPYVDAGMPRFEADVTPSGAAIWLKADLTAPKAPRIEVWAQGLSPVLGLAFHLGVDGAQLQIDSAGADPVMGLEARYLQKVRGSDISFGLAHLGAASGETDLTAPTRIAVVQLAAPGAVDSEVTLERVQARKADGSFVPLTAAAGRLVLPGGGK